MRRDQPTTPFDVEADDLTQQFWGASKGWVSSEQPAVGRRPERTRQRDDTTGSLKVIRDGFAAFRPQTSPNATGEIRRQRRHGAPSQMSMPDATSRREATLGELAAGHTEVGGWLEDDLGDDDPIPVRRSRPVAGRPEHDHDVPLTPVQPLVDRLGLGAIDPLLARAGMVVLALILLVPVVLSLRPDRDDTLPGEVVVDAPQQVAGAAPAATTTIAAAPAASLDAGASTPVDESEAGEPVPVDEPGLVVDDGESDGDRAAVESASATVETASAPERADDGAAVDAVAERLVPACPQTYTAAPGDSWYRIAEEAGVPPNELLRENNATTDTVILPGDDVCLPAGASMPSPPTTTVAPTTTDPADDPAPATTAAPTTTQAPTTTEAPVANLSRTEVQELIRQTWPEDEVDKALAVARRESNFIATADNGWCCYGVFQIYWTVHDGWLDDFGITERSDLFDARKNIAAAYAMWQRSGWGPWGG